MTEFSRYTQFPNNESKKFHGDPTHGNWVVREDEAKRRGTGRGRAEREGKGEGKGKGKGKGCVCVRMQK